MRFCFFIVAATALLLTNTAWSASYPPNTDYGSQGDFLAKRGTEFGRTADLAVIGPILINQPEAPGSTSTGVQYRFEDTAWDLSDLTNPTMIRSMTCPTCFAGQPINAHGTVTRFANDDAYLLTPAGIGGLGQYSQFDPAGQTSLDQLVPADGPWNHIPLDYSMLTSRYVSRMYWDYGFDPSGLHWIRDPSRPLVWDPNNPTNPTWLGEFVAEWDHLGLTGVTGFASWLGDLYVVASDQQSTGLAVYDVSRLSQGRRPHLLSVLQPTLTEPDGNTVGIGGYWMEPYGANKMVWAARERTDLTPSRTHPALFVADFSDPQNPRLTCAIYFDRDRNDPSDGDGSSDPMYVNFQDNFAFVDHFKVDIIGCEQAYSDGVISDAEFDQLVYKFDDIANHCDASQYFRPLGQVGVFGGYDWWVTRNRITYTGGVMDENHGFRNQNGEHFSIAYHQGSGVAVISNESIAAGDVVQDIYDESIPPFTITNATIDESINEQGMCFFVTSDQADTNPPYVSGHRPLDGQSNFPVDGFIHIHIPETLRSETVVNAVTVSRIDHNGNVIGNVDFEYQLSHTGTIAIFPNNDFVLEASYRVNVAGIQDFMGNTMAPYSFTFTTGDEDVGTPVPDPGNNPNTPAPTYAGTPYYPNKSSQLSCRPESEDNNLWVVNPDNHSVTIIDTNLDSATQLLTANTERELFLNYRTPTSVTRLTNGHVITYRDDDKVVLHDSDTGNPIYAIDTGHGSQPVASISDGQWLYVALYGSGEIVKIDPVQREIVARLNVGPFPKAMALTGNRLLVTRFISPTEFGQVYDINTNGNMALTRTITVNKVLVADDLNHGSGVPNFLSGIVISPDGNEAFVTAVKANTDRGLFRNGVALDSDNTIRPMMVRLDLVNNRDANTDPTTRAGTVDFDNAADPSAVTFLVDGEVRVVSLQGNNIVLAQNETDNTSAQFATGFAPQEMCTTLRTLYVKNFTDRTVSAIDVSGFIYDGRQNPNIVTLNSVSDELLSGQQLQGLQEFYHSSMPEMGPEGYMSCASCHADGGQDGRIWDITNLGEGLRNTLSLNGTSGTRFGDLHWSGNFDEVQDFELQIEQLNGGEGLVPGQTFNGQSPMEFDTAELSDELDALAAYVASLGKHSVKHSPFRSYTGGLTAAAQRGQQIFAAQNCDDCHRGAAFRDGELHDVGTIIGSSGSRLGGALTAIRTPTLIELWETAPYFHDGSAATLADVFQRGDHQLSLTAAELSDLGEYLLSIDHALFIDDDTAYPDF